MNEHGRVPSTALTINWPGWPESLLLRTFVGTTSPTAMSEMLWGTCSMRCQVMEVLHLCPHTLEFGKLEGFLQTKCGSTLQTLWCMHMVHLMSEAQCKLYLESVTGNPASNAGCLLRELPAAQRAATFGENKPGTLNDPPVSKTWHNFLLWFPGQHVLTKPQSF